MEKATPGHLLREARLRHGLTEKWETGIDITLNQGDLKLSAEHRVRRGLAFADLVRCNRPGGSGDLGRSVQIGPLLTALDGNQVDFVVIGSIAGLAHGSAYPTYDLDVAYARGSENLNNLVAAIEEIGFQMCREDLVAQDALSLDTQFGTLNVIGRVPGIDSYEQLQRDSISELLGGVVVDVASLNHLIAMKRAAGRRKDRLMVMEYVELADEIRRREMGG
ncbi:MAG: hypothetical protein ACJ76B_00550 [Solirubrobacterales bacterium]